MKTGRFTLGFAYLRLSNEEAQGGESSSITNQRMIVQNYCKQNGITLVREFVDDGYSRRPRAGNRPVSPISA